MMVKSTLLAMLVSLVILGSFAVAQAQSFVYSGASPRHLAFLGWNYAHLSSCLVVAGSGVYAGIAEDQTPGSYVFTNDPVFQNFAVGACQTGNLAGVHITRINPDGTYTWDMIQVFPFK